MEDTMTIDMDMPFAEFAEKHLKTPTGNNSALNAGLDRLRKAKATAFKAAKICKNAGKAEEEACFVGEVIGLEKAAALIYGEPI